MAIFNYDIQTVRRSRGQSAVEKAAYAAGLALWDGHGRVRWDHSAKAEQGGVLRHALLFPRISVDLGQFWTRAEEAETRRNSVVARTLMLALPHELDDLTNWEIACAHGRMLYRRHGLAILLGLHPPPGITEGQKFGGDPRNKHAHFVFSTRRVDGEGVFLEKARELDDRRRGSAHIERWRKHWERTVNVALARAGEKARISRLSHVRAGRDQRPGEHLGPVAAARAKKGLHVPGNALNQSIADLARSDVRVAALEKDFADARAERHRLIDLELAIIHRAADRRADARRGADEYPARQAESSRGQDLTIAVLVAESSRRSIASQLGEDRGLLVFSPGHPQPLRGRERGEDRRGDREPPHEPLRGDRQPNRPTKTPRPRPHPGKSERRNEGQGFPFPESIVPAEALSPREDGWEREVVGLEPASWQAIPSGPTGPEVAHSRAPLGGSGDGAVPPADELPAELLARVDVEMDLPRVCREHFNFEELEAGTSPEGQDWTVCRRVTSQDDGQGGIALVELRLRLWREATVATHRAEAMVSRWRWSWQSESDEWHQGGYAADILAWRWEEVAPQAKTESFAQWVEQLLTTPRQSVGRRR